MAHYATAFGPQWWTYRRTQLDSYNGGAYSRTRLERCLGAPLESFKGQTVLEVGCGAGRFTEWLIPICGTLVCLDASEAVYANRANCAHLGRYELIQGDINASPLARSRFELVLCLGVIQHTPSPEQTIASLGQHVAPGGMLVIDHYTWRSRWSPITQRLTLRYPLRAVLRRVALRRPDLSLRLTRLIVTVCDPIRCQTGRYRMLDNLAARVFPSNCYYSIYTDIPRAIVREWNQLDTHDSLTDWYKHQRTARQIEAGLEAAGLVDIEVWRGGNGIEARARKPCL
jgi:SAM-dependent methyltransferase